MKALSFSSSLIGFLRTLSLHALVSIQKHFLVTCSFFCILEMIRAKAKMYDLLYSSEGST